MDLRIIIEAMIVLIAVCLICYLAVHFENKKFRTTTYQYYTDKLTAPVRLCVLSDLHNYCYGAENDKLMAAIKECRPDYVISAGDMIEGGRFVKGTGSTVEFLAKLCERFSFVYGCGNHEWKLMMNKAHYPKLSQEFEEGLEEARAYLKKHAPEKVSSIEPLNNRCCELGSNIKVYGLNLEYDYFKKVILNKTSAEHISELVGRPDSDKLNILIGHNPDQFDAYADWGADLVLSGHIHGGMIATPWHRGLISPRFIPFPKYDWGEYKKGKTTMLLSRGMGNHTIHIRIFNRAELMVVDILPKQNN